MNSGWGWGGEWGALAPPTTPDGKPVHGRKPPPIVVVHARTLEVLKPATWQGGRMVEKGSIVVVAPPVGVDPAAGAGGRVAAQGQPSAWMLLAVEDHGHVAKIVAGFPDGRHAEYAVQLQVGHPVAPQNRVALVE